jgi:hypothetical protein
MEKTITIDGRDIRFKSTGATPLRYKAQFGKDYFAEILKLNSLKNINEKEIKPEDLDGVDFEVFYNIAWALAKTANKDIPDPLTWLDEFEEFPMIDIIPELIELILSSLKTKKK